MTSKSIDLNAKIINSSGKPNLHRHSFAHHTHAPSLPLKALSRSQQTINASK